MHDVKWIIINTNEVVGRCPDHAACDNIFRGSRGEYNDNFFPYHGVNKSFHAEFTGAILAIEISWACDYRQL